MALGRNIFMPRHPPPPSQIAVLAVGTSCRPSPSPSARTSLELPSLSSARGGSRSSARLAMGVGAGAGVHAAAITPGLRFWSSATAAAAAAVRKRLAKARTRYRVKRRARGAGALGLDIRATVRTSVPLPQPFLCLDGLLFRLLRWWYRTVAPEDKTPSLDTAPSGRHDNRQTRRDTPQRVEFAFGGLVKTRPRAVTRRELEWAPHRSSLYGPPQAAFPSSVVTHQLFSSVFGGLYRMQPPAHTPPPAKQKQKSPAPPLRGAGASVGRRFALSGPDAPPFGGRGGGKCRRGSF